MNTDALFGGSAKGHSSQNNFFTQELAKLPRDRKLYYDAKGAWICCPNPEHSNGMEKTPSLKINVEGKFIGRGYCFGCKTKYSWNSLAKYFNLKKLRGGAVSSNIGFSFKKFEHEESIPDFDKFPLWNKDVDWKRKNSSTITGKTLHDLNVRVIQRGEEIFLIIPVTTYNEPVGFIRALFREPRKGPRGKEKTYINMSGTWSHENLFMFDQANSKKFRKSPLWIVEGPRDALNVYQKGGRVVGLIGSAVTRQKLALIKELDPPVIIVATDNDDAGNNAAKVVEDEISALINCVRLRFKNGRDPADLSASQVSKYIELASKHI